MSYLHDTFTNFLSGLGVPGRDKSTGFAFTRPIWTREQLESSYTSDWITRKVIETPAQNSAREWRTWQAKKDQIKKLEATKAKLRVQQVLQRALARARLYGGSCVLLGVDGDQAS